MYLARTGNLKSVLRAPFGKEETALSRYPHEKCFLSAGFIMIIWHELHEFSDWLQQWWEHCF